MPVRARLEELAAAGADLAFGSVCAGCAAEPGLVCAPCRDELIGPPAALRELPGTVRLRVAGAAAYAGPVGAIIVAHKERGRLALSRPLGDAMAVAVTALTAAEGGCPGCGERPAALVPVPSRRSTVRGRGHDPVVRIARRAASVLRRAGQEASVVPALRHTRGVADQADLGRVARAANLRGSMAMRRSAPRLLTGQCVVLVDDIITTGSTLRECATVLQTAGVRCCGAAVVAIAR